MLIACAMLLLDVTHEIRLIIGFVRVSAPKVCGCQPHFQDCFNFKFLDLNSDLVQGGRFLSLAYFFRSLACFF